MVLCNLKEGFSYFNEINEGIKVGFSVFAACRPVYCILAGGKGTHTVCVCKIHQNFKLLLNALNLERLDEQNKKWDYKDILKRIMCESPTPDCHFGIKFFDFRKLLT